MFCIKVKNAKLPLSGYGRSIAFLIVFKKGGGYQFDYEFFQRLYRNCWSSFMMHLANKRESNIFLRSLPSYLYERLFSTNIIKKSQYNGYSVQTMVEKLFQNCS